MYNSETEVLFPLRFSSALADLRDEGWKSLVENVNSSQAPRVVKIGFILMMVRLNGCIGCNADSYRAMKGCTACARQTIRRFRNSEQELLNLYEQARLEAEHFLEKQENHRNIG